MKFASLTGPNGEKIHIGLDCVVSVIQHQAVTKVHLLGGHVIDLHAPAADEFMKTFDARFHPKLAVGTGHPPEVIVSGPSQTGYRP